MLKLKDKTIKKLDALAAIELSRSTPEIKHIFKEYAGLNFPLFLPTLMSISQHLNETNKTISRLTEIINKSYNCADDNGNCDNNV